MLGFGDGFLQRMNVAVAILSSRTGDWCFCPVLLPAPLTARQLLTVLFCFLFLLVAWRTHVKQSPQYCSGHVWVLVWSAGLLLRGKGSSEKQKYQVALFCLLTVDASVLMRRSLGRSCCFSSAPHTELKVSRLAIPIVVTHVRGTVIWQCLTPVVHKSKWLCEVQSDRELDLRLFCPSRTLVADCFLLYPLA